MKRRDEGKASLVDFLSSIKFSTRKGKRRDKGQEDAECNTHFAALDPHAPPAKNNNSEDDSVERSAN